MNKKLSSFDLKLVAIITMTIDHIGVFFFPNIIGFRIIGRISFVLFAYLAANTMIYTRHKVRHIVELFVYALILLIPVPFGYEFANSSIFLTLAIGAGSIYLFEEINKIFLDDNRSDTKFSFSTFIIIVCLSFALAAISENPIFQYQWYGTLLIFGIYLIQKYLKQPLIYITLLITVLGLFGVPLLRFADVQYFALLAVPFIYFYSGERGYYSKFSKYFFYIFYPLHLGVLALLANILK
ncbi:MAG: TraX family protein [Mycoplasmatales bacterium]